MRVDHEKKSDGVRGSHERERESGVMRVDYRKQSDGLRVYHKKE